MHTLHLHRHGLNTMQPLLQICGDKAVNSPAVRPLHAAAMSLLDDCFEDWQVPDNSDSDTEDVLDSLVDNAMGGPDRLDASEHVMYASGSPFNEARRVVSVRMHVLCACIWVPGCKTWLGHHCSLGHNHLGTCAPATWHTCMSFVNVIDLF